MLNHVLKTNGTLLELWKETDFIRHKLQEKLHIFTRKLGIMSKNTSVITSKYKIFNTVYPLVYVQYST